MILEEPTNEEVIALLGRWLLELRTDLAVNEWRAHQREQVLAGRIVELERTVSGYAFWMRAGLSPVEIYEASRELDPAVVGAA